MMRMFFDMLFLYSNNLLRIINFDYRPAKYSCTLRGRSI